MAPESIQSGLNQLMNGERNAQDRQRLPLV